MIITGAWHLAQGFRPPARLAGAGPMPSMTPNGNAERLTSCLILVFPVDKRSISASPGRMKIGSPMT
jgi:hypothetical protein